MPFTEDQSGVDALKAFRSKGAPTQVQPALQPSGADALNIFRRSRVTVNPEGEFYKRQLAEYLSKPTSAPVLPTEPGPPEPKPPSEAPRFPGETPSLLPGAGYSSIGVKVPVPETMLPGPQAQPKAGISIFAPLVDFGAMEKARIDAEKKAGSRYIAGPRGLGVVRVEPTGPLQSGIRVGAANLMSTLTSPLGIAIGATPLLPVIGMLSPALKMAIEAGFTAQMAYGFISRSKEAVDAYRRGDQEGFGRAATEAIGDGVFTYLVGKGVIDDARKWYGLFKTALGNTPRPTGPIEEVGPREPAEPSVPPEVTEGIPQVAIERAKAKIAEIEKLQEQQKVKETAEKLAKAKTVEPPEWPPATPETQAAAERAFAKAQPTKEELTTRAREFLGVEPPKPGTLAQPTPEKPLEGPKPSIYSRALEEKNAPGVRSYSYEEGQTLGRLGYSSEDMVTMGWDRTHEVLEKQIPKSKNKQFVTEKPTKRKKGKIDKVVAMIAAGKDDAQIAFKLDVKESDVRSIRAGEVKKLPVDWFGEQPEGWTPESHIVEERRRDAEIAAGVGEPEVAVVPEEKAAVAEPVRTKIEQTTEPERILQPEDYAALDRQFGEDWGSLPSEQIKAFLEGRAEGKPVTDIDIQAGTPEPEGLSTEDSPFREDPETSALITARYAKNPAIAKNIKELLSQDPNNPTKFLEPTVWNLQHEVNRYINGENVDIVGVRNFINDLATNIDSLSPVEELNEWRETIRELSAWARKAERPEGGEPALYSGLPVDEIVRRLRKLHPATYPISIQKSIADVVNKLGITDVLDIFAGVGKIGQIKEYGYTGKVRSNEIEPKWGGVSTRQLHKKYGVDEINIGDARKLPYKDNSIQSIATSPTYGNLMALRSPSKIDSYQALAGGKLREGNTGGEVWGPEYERLHKEAYKEAYRVVKPGGFFILNMKDKPVTAADVKNNWIPKKGSTVEVRDGVMRATDWHIRALEDAGFEFIASTPVEEATAVSAHQKFLRQYTVGEENIVVLGKPDRPKIKPTGGISLYSGIDPFEVAKGIRKWYSSLRKVAEDKLPNIASSEQIANTLRKQVTADEWKKSKLEELLKPGMRVRKEEVLAQIDRNVPEFKDVVLEDRPQVSFEDWARANGIDPREPEAYQIFTERANRLGRIDYNAKFSTYVEPGAIPGTYKELFVTDPTERPSVINLPNNWVVKKEPSNLYTATDPETGIVGIADSKFDAIEQAKELYYMRMFRYYEWRDGHPDYLDIENPIVRLRFNDRTDAQGKKVLFIEELQPPLPAEFEKMPAEFQKRWREIGIKRAIKYAIDGGYDRVAWTTGEMQASRYSLSRHISKIQWHRTDFGNYHLDWWTREGVARHRQEYIKPKDLAEYIGVDLANRINSSNDMVGTIEGLDLETGGEGLRKLYDSDLPNVAKKLGGKVEITNLNMNSQGTRLYDSYADFVMRYRQDNPNAGMIEIDKAYRDFVTNRIKPVPSFSISPFRERAYVPTLYSGIPFDRIRTVLKDIFSRTEPGEKPEQPPDTVSEIIAAGRRGAEVLLEAEKIQKFNAAAAAKDLREQFNKRWLSQSGNIRRRLELYGKEGSKIIQAAALAKGGHPHATNMLRQARREVSAGLSKNEKKILTGLIFHERMVAIAKTPAGRRFAYFKKHPVIESVAYVEGLAGKKINLVQNLTPDREALIRKAAETHFEWIKKPVQAEYDEGLIGQEELNELLSHNYQRVRLADPTIAKLFDKRREVILGGRKRSVYDSGIETLASGKQTDIFEKNHELLMLEMYNRIYNRVYNNKANRMLQALARKDPGNPFVRVREPEVEPISKQPTSGVGLRNSIEIKRLSLGISDYELRAKLRSMFKKSKVSKLSLEELAKFEASLGPGSMKYVSKSAAKIPPGWRRHFVYENGARKNIWLEPEFSDEWLTTSPEMTGGLARLARTASFSPLVRAFATGVNPVFALRNLPRDMMHAWFASRIYEDGKWDSVYSTFAPKFLYQIGSDYAHIFNDALLRKGSYNDYIEDGGGMDFLVLQGRPFRKGLRLEKPIDKIYDFLGYLNETSEIATRLAIRNRVIRTRAREQGLSVKEASKNKDIREEATFAALDQMNFGEGGGFSKALDNILPYINARIVGTRSFFRSFRPGSGTAKQSWIRLAQFAGIVAGIYLLNKNRSPETMEALEGDRRTQRNIVWPLGDSLGFKDESGETRYPFLIIPIDQGQQFLKTFFEAATDLWQGNKVDVTRVVQALKDSSPADVTTLPPSLAALLGYATNTNFWLQQDIFRGAEESFGYQLPKMMTGKPLGGSEEEYTPGRTPEALITMGMLTGLSPERLKYGLGQLITNDNFYAQLLGGAYEQMFGVLPKDQREETLAEALSKVPVIGSFVKITNPRSRHGQEIAEGKEEATIKNFVENRGLDALARGYLFKKSVSVKEVLDYIEKDPLTGKAREIEDYDRLTDRFDFHEQTKDLPDRSFWLMLKGITDPQARAKTYVEILESSTPKERARILAGEADVMAIEAGKTPNFNIFSEPFMNEVVRLMQSKVKYPGPK